MANSTLTFDPSTTTIKIFDRTLNYLGTGGFLTLERPNAPTSRTIGAKGDVLITNASNTNERTLAIVVRRGSPDDNYMQTLLTSKTSPLTGNITLSYLADDGSTSIISYIYSNGSFTAEGSKGFDSVDAGANSDSSYTITATINTNITKI